MRKKNRVIFITVIAFLLYSCSPTTIEIIPTPILTPKTIPTNTPTELPLTLTTTVESTKIPEPSKCPIVGSAGSSWERYKPNTLENIVALASQVSSPAINSGVSFYIETSGEHQIPSCVTAEYTGRFREISEERIFLIEAWSGIFSPERQQRIIDNLKHEVLLIENLQEYWIPVQEPLIPFMENELTKNEPVTVFIIWVGTTYLGEETDHVFVIGEFTKP